MQYPHYTKIDGFRCVTLPTPFGILKQDTPKEKSSSRLEHNHKPWET